MIKTRLGAMIGGAFWTPGAVQIGSSSKNLTQIIKSIFATGEQGFAYDPNDLTTLYQDATGTIPVTASGQPVGLMLDKSGRNNHASQTVSASRPILQRNATTGAYYLAFDGVDDFLQTNNIDFTATDKVSLFAGVRKLSDSAIGMIAELSLSAENPDNTGSFYMTVPLSAISAAVRVYVRGVDGTSAVAAPLASFTGTAPLVVSANMSLLGNLNLNVNRTVFSSVSNKIGNYGNYPLYIGRRGGNSLPFNGHLYSLIGIGRLTTDSETIALEKAIAKNTGVTLNV